MISLVNLHGLKKKKRELNDELKQELRKPEYKQDVLKLKRLRGRISGLCSRLSKKRRGR